LYSRAREPQNILKLVPNGSTVKKGDVVCELDSAALKDAFTDQLIAVATAESIYRNRVTAREIANMSLREYADLWKLELAETEVARYRAESGLAVAEDSVEAGVKDLPDRLSLKAARFALEAAQIRKKVLLEVSRPKRVRELELAVAMARTEELTSKGRWDSEANKEKRLNREIEACVIRAPRDGILMHAGPLEEGATVKPRQLLFKVVPVNPPGPAPK
jgi:HlyD family secretion protein